VHRREGTEQVLSVGRSSVEGHAGAGAGPGGYVLAIFGKLQ
jgi:hypothetical protein